METREYQVYKYEELPDEIKAKVIERYWDINVDDDHWFDYDGKTGFSADEIKKYRLELEHADDLLTYKKLYFDCGRNWYIQFVDAQFKHDETARKFLGVPRALWNQVEWNINDCPYRETNTRLEYESGYDRDYRDFTDKQKAILDRAVERFSDKVEEALKGLRDSYDYLVTKEAIEETIEVNEYNFTLDGKID